MSGRLCLGSVGQLVSHSLRFPPSLRWWRQTWSDFLRFYPKFYTHISDVSNNAKNNCPLKRSRSQSAWESMAGNCRFSTCIKYRLIPKRKILCSGRPFLSKLQNILRGYEIWNRVGRSIVIMVLKTSNN